MLSTISTGTQSANAGSDQRCKRQCFPCCRISLPYTIKPTPPTNFLLLLVNHLFARCETMAFPGHPGYLLVMMRRYCSALWAALARESSMEEPEPWQTATGLVVSLIRVWKWPVIRAEIKGQHDQSESGLEEIFSPGSTFCTFVSASVPFLCYHSSM